MRGRIVFVTGATSGIGQETARQLAAMGATPVGLPLPQIPDALSKGTIDACAIPWEGVPSVKVHELTKFHSEFQATGPAYQSGLRAKTARSPGV